MNSKVLFYKQSKKTFSYFNNGLRSNSMLLDRRHNNMRVISTPEFPVPYYQRITRAAPSTEHQTVDFRKLMSPVDQCCVIQTKEKLARTSEGLKVLEFVENKMNLSSYQTSIKNVTVQANIYSEDLLNYIDSTNFRILKEVDLSDCLRV